MSLDLTPRVVVVGGGVIGLSSAWRLAQGGAAVTVVDPAPARGASWVAAGMLAPVSETEPGDHDRVALLLEAARRWPAFAAELEGSSGRTIGFLTCGTLTVAVTRSDLAVVDDLVDLQGRLGLEVTRLSSRECRELVPALAPGVCGGALMPVDHQVDNRRLLEALQSACQGAGVGLQRARVAGVTRSTSGRVDGVQLEDGAGLAAGVVLVAAGAWSGRLVGLPSGALPPVRPVKGQILRLRHLGSEPVVDRTVRGLVQGRSVYLVPRGDGSMVIGATVEEQGFDLTIRAGAVHDLLHDARLLVPAVEDLVLEEQLAGLRPATVDNAPLVGWTGIPGLAVATGHFRNGILLAPLTADAVQATVLGGPPCEAFRHFSAVRAGLR